MIILPFGCQACRFFFGNIGDVVYDDGVCTNTASPRHREAVKLWDKCQSKEPYPLPVNQQRVSHGGGGVTLEEAEEAVEAWRLWELLPEPKRLHCDAGVCSVIVSAPRPDGYCVGPHTDMDTSVWIEAATALEALRQAVAQARQLGWLEVAE